MTPKNWKPQKLKELGFVGRGKSKHRPRNEPSLYGGNYPFVQTGDIKAADLYLREYSQTYNDKGLAQSKLWKSGTLCITIAANIAETAILGMEACFPDSVVGFVADDNKSDVRFIKYYIDTIKLRMQNISQGTTQDNLSLEKLNTFDVLTPPLPTQRRIADILSAYDDLIENNTRRIRILEQMAQAIYQERFGKVDKQSLPKGWEVDTLGNHLSVDRGVSHKGEFMNGEGLPLLNLKSFAMSGGYRTDGLKSYSGDYKPKHVVHAGDIVLANTDLTQAGSIVGNPAIVPNIEGEILFTHHLYAVRFSSVTYLRKYYLYHLLSDPSYKSFAKGRAIGTTVLGLAQDGVLDFEFIRPPKELVKEFEEVITPFYQLKDSLEAKNANLRQTRDLLLPRLVSGEIEV